MINKTLFNLGNFTGKIGNCIFYRHRNRICIRSISETVKPPSSPGQLAQQERIAALANLYQALKEAKLHLYWQKAAEGLLQNGYNLLVKTNLPAFSGQGTVCDFSKLLITLGKVALPNNLKLTADPHGGQILEWSNAPLTPHANADDRLRIVMMKDYETFDVKPLDMADYSRSNCRAVFRIPESLKDFSHLYVIFCSRVDGTCSSSRYFNINPKSYGNL